MNRHIKNSGKKKTTLLPVTLGN